MRSMASEGNTIVGSRSRAWAYMSEALPITLVLAGALDIAFVMRSMYLSALGAIWSTSSAIRFRPASLGTIFLRSSIWLFRYVWAVWRAVLKVWLWNPQARPRIDEA